MTLHYDSPTSTYTSHIPPGVASFRRIVGPHYGFTRIEVVRDQSRCAGQRSRHCQCAAIDFFTTDLTPTGKGRRLFEWALSNADPLDIQGGIFNRRCFGLGGTWTERSYHGQSPHIDHVHIEFNNHGAATLTDNLVKAHLPGTGGDTDMDAEDKKVFKEIRDDLATIARALTDGNAGQTLAEQGGTNQRLDRLEGIAREILAQLKKSDL